MKKEDSRKLKTALNTNSGFTLVELIVVLVLLVILLSIAILGGLAWQDWTRFKHENAVAEDIFFAAQNQLTDLDKSDALEREVLRPISASDAANAKPNGYADYVNVLAYSELNGNGTNLGMEDISDDDGSYSWAKIWGQVDYLGGKKTNQNNQEKRTIVSLRADAGDYEDYLKIRKGESVSGFNADKILLFDLISPYIADKSVLSGSIVIEFCPEVGQVLAVCYSDRAEGLEYASTASTGHVSVLDRTEKTRRDNMLGYYSVNVLAEKLKGRSQNESSVNLWLLNEQTLHLKVRPKDNADLNGRVLNFTLYNGANNKSKDKLMKFSIPYDDITKTSLEDACREPITLTHSTDKKEVQMLSGIYAESSEYTFRFPVYKDQGDIYIILDGADVQAGTASYLGWRRDGKPEAANAFRNTYSFYRFGLTGVKSVYASAEVSDGPSVEEATYSMYLNSQSQAEIANANANKRGATYYGESPTFYTAAAESNYTEYTLFNARHFYNMRYETEYHETESGSTAKSNRFVLVNNIDWQTFVKGSGSAGPNYFLNSADYDAGSTLISGIGFKGNSKTTRDPENTSRAIDYGTNFLPFPSFRCLGAGDVFTQEKAYGEEGYCTISNLNISFAANIAYGIYDDAFASVQDGMNLKAECMEAEEAAGFSGILGMSNYLSVDSTGSNLVRAGKMPLGLFAENLGTISNIVLDKHTVMGIESTKYPVADNAEVDQVVATVMVGGFVGNNLGKLENLTLLSTEDSSFVSGRSDVGGILGRESFISTSFEGTDVVLKGLQNQAKVTGLENVGGIVGRAYTNFVNNTDDATRRTYSKFKSSRKNGAANDFYIAEYVENTTENEKKYNPRYPFYHDGYSITDDYRSMTGLYTDAVNVKRVRKITIEDCSNTGVVCGDAYYHGRNIDVMYARVSGNPAVLENLSVKTRTAYPSFIGGIAGIAMDGLIFDTVNVVTNDPKVSGPVNYYFESENKNFANGGVESWVLLKNCSSFTNYNIADVASDPAISQDNYKGGLVGYARFSAFEDCNNDPGDINNYVLGHQYVGGVAGCVDLCYFAPTDDEPGATNYNNVIGRRYVGGVAGAFGIGDTQQEGFSFRYPAGNEATDPSQYHDGLSDTDGNSDRGPINTGKMVIAGNMDNAGVVLGRKATGGKDTYTPSFIGGVAGISVAGIADCDNIQSDKTKALAMRLITGNTTTDPTDLYTIAPLELERVIDNSNYGGVYVGGIIGGHYRRSSLNILGNTRSEMDAVVYGETVVGGAVGGANGSSDIQDCMNAYPVKKGTQGLLVVGKYGVGGQVGQLGRKLINNMGEITTPYTVKGVYGVGGIIGYISDGRKGGETSVTINTTSPVIVDGAYYVGGFAGVAEMFSDNVNRKVTLKNMQITGDYFVGGVYGSRDFCATGNAVDDSLRNITNPDGNRAINVHNTVKVEARQAFAGGVSGIFTRDAKTNKTFKEFFSAPYPINSENPSYGDMVTKAQTLLKATDTSSLGYGDAYANVLAYNWCVNDNNEKAQSERVNISFSGAVEMTPEVKAPLFAGGLFGFVPDGTTITVVGYSNNCKVTTTAKVTNVLESADRNVAYSYLGGVTGRIPNRMVVDNCINNMMQPDKYISSAIPSYLGSLSEVNAGTIQNCVINADIRYESLQISVGGLTGVNGVCKYGQNAVTDVTATIQNCTNNAVIAAGKNVAAMAGAMDGSSLIAGCVNNGALQAVGTDSIAAGMAAQSWKVGTHKIQGSINNGSVGAKGNAAGILGKADNAAGVTSVTECKNFGTITARDGDTVKTAAGIAADTGMGNIEYCRNYGALTGQNQYGITAAATNKLLGNLVANGFNEGTAEAHLYPIAPNDNVTDENHIRNFYISGTTDAGPSDPPEPDPEPTGGEAVTIGLNPAAVNISVPEEAISFVHDCNGWKITAGQYYDSQSWGNTLTGMLSYTSGSAKNPYIIYVYQVIFEGHTEDYTDKYGNNREGLNNYLKKLFAGYCYYKKILPTSVTFEGLLSYAEGVLATNDLDYNEETPRASYALKLSKTASSADFNDVEDLGDPYGSNQKIYERFAWGYGYTKSMIDPSVLSNSPDLIYLYHSKFGSTWDSSFNIYLGKIYAKCWLEKAGSPDRITTANQPTPEEFKEFYENFIDANASSGSTQTPDDSHWPVQLYVYSTGEGDDKKYSLLYKRWDKFFACGMNDLINNPNADSIKAYIDAKNYTSIKELDDAFMAMVKETTNYPNSSVKGTHPQGFVKP